METHDSEKLVDLGINYASDGLYPQAIRIFEKVLDQDRDNVDAHYNLGVIYGRCAMDDLSHEEIFEDTTNEEVLREKAVAELLEVLRIDSEHTAAMNNLGTLYALNAQIGQALEMWHSSLASDPDQPEVIEEKSQYETD